MHVGAVTIVPSIQQAVLVKFADFNPMLYPDTIIGVKKDEAEKAEEKAKKEEKAEKQKKIAAENTAGIELEEIGVGCGECVQACPTGALRAKS